MNQKYKLFISSVQTEFADERKSLADYIRKDPLLGSFFIPFIFEETAANTYSVQEVYINQVKQSDIYIGIIGEQYGYEDEEGVSATEREYDIAKSKYIPRWMYLKQFQQRHPKVNTLINKIEKEVSRKMFVDPHSLKDAVYQSCVLFLKQMGKISSHDFDNCLQPDLTLSAIDASLVKDFVRQARSKRRFPLKETASIVDVLTHLRLLKENKIVNSALLVFTKNPQDYFPAAVIKCAHFHDIIPQKPIPDFKVFAGTVFQMADDAVDFILSKLSLSSGTRDTNNIVETTYEIPRAVIAEAIINAVAHRDYYSKASVQVSVFKNRIEISNPGKLPPELSKEDLKISHSSYPHNPLLAECMFLYGAIERFGTGMLDIFNKTKELGLKTPDIELNEGFKLVIWRPSAFTVHDTVHDTIHDTIHDVTYMEFEHITHRLIWVMKDAMSRSEIMALLELRNRAYFVENYLESAFSQGLIVMTIPDKPQSKYQKYTLTQKGLELQHKLKEKREKSGK